MFDFSKSLGDAIRQTRTGLGLTQNDVANLIHIDGRTILNIENYKGNPKMEVLYPLIRALKVDPIQIFYPEINRLSPEIEQLRLIIEDCSDKEAVVLITVIKTVLSVLRNNDSKTIE